MPASIVPCEAERLSAFAALTVMPRKASSGVKRKKVQAMLSISSSESAGELPADIRARVQADLAGAYGPSVTVSFEEEPALIGGLRVTVGSDVYDGSVRAALSALEARFP